MGIAALILGIISFIVALIPLCGYFAFLPAIIGLILGIVYVVKQSKVEDGKKGMGIAGIILNALAIIFIIAYTILFIGIGANTDLNELLEDYNTSYYDSF